MITNLASDRNGDKLDNLTNIFTIILTYVRDMRGNYLKMRAKTKVTMKRVNIVTIITARAIICFVR